MEAPVAIKVKDTPRKAINSKDSNYDIELEINNSKLCIKAMTKTKLEKILYLYEDSIENIYKLDRYFFQFETIKEIEDNIFEILKEENYDLIGENNKLKLLLKPTVGKQTKNIELILNKTEGNNDTLINIVINRMNALESDYKNFQTKHEQFVESTQKDIISLKKENENLKNQIKESKELTME